MVKRNVILSLLALSSLLFITACSDDETPKATIGFELEEDEITESDGTSTSFHPDLYDDGAGRDIKVNLIFDRKVEETSVISYTLDGTASTESTENNDVPDFEILAEGENATVDDENITIAKGAESASIILRIYEDFSFEYDEDDGLEETITLELNEVVSGSIVLDETSTTSYTLTITEDDPVVYLMWYVDGSDDAETVNTVDMDLYVWMDGEVVNASTYDNSDGTYEYPYEGLFIPAGFPDGTYGLSYNYYSGSSDDVYFGSLMWGHVEGDFYAYPEDDYYLLAEGTYTTDNLNASDETGIDPLIVQTMDKSGINFTNISEIEIPESGSRMKSSGSQMKSIYLKNRNNVLKRLGTQQFKKSAKSLR